MITLTLPYPISANRYWASRAYRDRKTGNWMTMTYVTKDAENFKEQVGWMCKGAGIRTPLTGRVAITVRLYPQRPQDWAKRQRTQGANWDDTVRCIDLDNANKVLLDALKGVAIVDDGWQVRSLHCDRMEPDGEARVEMTITALEQPVVQPDLLGAMA